MRLFAATLIAGLVANGTAQASSLVFLADSASSPSSVTVGTPANARSVIALGSPMVDAAKVATIAAKSTSKLGRDVLVIRSGEIGSASADPLPVAQPAAAAPTQQADAEPVPAPANEPAAAPATDLVH